MEAAQAAARTNTYLSDQYHHLAARRGRTRAILAVAHSILVIVYHLLRGTGTYNDLGPAYLDTRRQERTTRRLVRQLQRLDHAVTLETAA